MKNQHSIKKGLSQIVLCILLLLCLCPAMAWSADQSGEWLKVRESEGVIGWTRATPVANVEEVRAEGIIDAPLPVVEAILRDTPAAKKFMFMCSESYRINLPGLKNTKDSYYTYFRQGLPWPVADRYGVGRIDFMFNKTTGVLVAKGRAVAADFKPPEKNIIRIPLGDATWTMIPMGENKTKLTYRVIADPAGNLPSSLVKMLMKNVGVTTIKNIRELARQEPYRNIRTLVTTTPYHE